LRDAIWIVATFVKVAIKSGKEWASVKYHYAFLCRLFDGWPCFHLHWGSQVLHYCSIIPYTFMTCIRTIYVCTHTLGICLLPSK
jgi:hypothetical protein